MISKLDRVPRLVFEDRRSATRLTFRDYTIFKLPFLTSRCSAAVQLNEISA